jgi:hypothetical protein
MDHHVAALLAMAAVAGKTLARQALFHVKLLIT